MCWRTSESRKRLLGVVATAGGPSTLGSVQEEHRIRANPGSLVTLEKQKAK